MGSGLNYPIANCLSTCLFQWDPGEHTRASRNLVEEAGTPVYSSECAEQLSFKDFLLDSSCAAQSKFYLLYPKVSMSVSFTARSSMYALSLTSALTVDDDRIANKHKVLLPLKLLMSLSKSKLSVSLYLPQCTQAMVT
jgi:hypothetical protein